MKPLEGRITALERISRKPLPMYVVTLEDGTEARMDALGVHLHLARAQAGIAPRIISTRWNSGPRPSAALQSEISGLT